LASAAGKQRGAREFHEGHVMNTIRDGSFDPDFDKTLSSYADRRHGYYNPGESWEVYLNVKAIRAAGIYDEIYAHEHMHHQLMCSSAFGHAQQIVTRLARRRERFKIIQQALMQLSWAVHEGAAMLAGFHAHCAASATSNELQALAETPDHTGNAVLQIQVRLER